ncbi:hypothetical protein BD779DRAFT_1476619 [Infundibulicybe gibba]|nr:hypothetical protein BD779DRAFT_1476619 [Infundibulicybe gibba]
MFFARGAFQGLFWFNTIIGGLLAWRAMRRIPRYSLVVFALYDDSIQLSSMSWTWTIINIIIDFLLYNVVWPGVRAFITGHLWLRVRWGFKKTEIVFRKPTGWRLAALKDLPPEEFQRQYADILHRAIDPKLVSENPGYLTYNDYWVLEDKAVGDAYSLVAKGEIDIKTWDLSEKLKSMGKEDIIEQWKSMGTPGAPTTPTNAVMDLFRSQGVNYEELWAEATKEATTKATGRAIMFLYETNFVMRSTDANA